MTEVGFVKGQSDNLPKVDSFMVAEFFANSDLYTSAEIRGIKQASAGRENYGDSAIGYVQVKREGQICTVKAKVCPEHKVKKKNYAVTLEVNEADEKVVSAVCNDCAASLGGCKHSIAFLMWIHRRSEEPAPTEVACYWKKSKLATVGTNLKFITVAEFGTVECLPLPQGMDKTFLEDVIESGTVQGASCEILKYFSAATPTSLSLHNLLCQFVRQGGETVNEFLHFLKVTQEDCDSACQKTIEQSECRLWHELRYGRITASRIYEAARCKTPQGTLVETIVGSLKLIETKAMKRGKFLEKKVVSVLEQEQNVKFCAGGFMVSTEHPFIGASPDAVSKDYVVEIKCPSSIKTMTNYVKDNIIVPKCKAQINLQMKLFNKKQGIFCIADPSFEVNNKITTYILQYDEEFTENIIDGAKHFWCQNIFPCLLQAAKS